MQFLFFDNQKIFWEADMEWKLSLFRIYWFALLMSLVDVWR